VAIGEEADVVGGGGGGGAVGEEEAEGGRWRLTQLVWRKE